MLQKYRKLFSPGIQKRIETGTSCYLSQDDKAFAVALESMGPKAYKFLRANNFPFPHPSTLKDHTSKLNLRPGFIDQALPALSRCLKSNLDKYCVIMFDEMKLRRFYEYDHKSKTVRRPCDNALVFMVKGLFQNYQQVVYYNYDEVPTKSRMESIISKLEAIGVIVVASVCDLGTKNVGLWNSLGVTMEKPYFQSISGNNIYCFADTPHVIKSLRNHFIDKGFIVDGKEVTSASVRRLLSCQSVDIGVAYRLTEKHFPQEGLKRQKVSLATQMFSNSVAAGIRRLEQLSLNKPDLYPAMPKDTQNTATFAKQINDWFDIMNTHAKKTDSRDTKKGYGLEEAIEEQNRILNMTKNTILGARAIGKKALLPCQKGLIQSINALQMMYKELKEKEGITYLLTRRLNQDPLECLFGYLRSMGGGLHDHPSALEFENRLKKCSMGKLFNCCLITLRNNYSLL